MSESEWVRERERQTDRQTDRKTEGERDRETERQRDIRDRVAETRTLAQAVFSSRAHTRRRVSFLHARARLEVLVSFRTRGHCGNAVSWARVAVKGVSSPPGRSRAVQCFGLSPDMVPIDGVPKSTMAAKTFPHSRPCKIWDNFSALVLNENCTELRKAKSQQRHTTYL